MHGAALYGDFDVGAREIYAVDVLAGSVGTLDAGDPVDRAPLRIGDGGGKRHCEEHGDA